MSEAVGIKETMEMLDGLKLLAIETKKVLADGKVNVADLPILIELLQQLNVLTAAVAGAGQIPAEAKDLSADELQTIGAKVLEMVAAFKAA